MRSLFLALTALFAAACTEAAIEGDGFTDFWSAFRAAVEADDSAAVRRLTRLPILFDGEQTDSSGFGPVYDALFAAPARSCLAASTPVPEDGRYVAFCGPFVYLFERAADHGWRFAEFTADPEADADEDVAPVAASEAALGSWRIVDGRAAPWAAAADRLANAALAGTRVEVSATHVLASHPLGCRHAEPEFVVSPAEGLFQGNLPGPAAAAAHGLGIARLPALTLRVRCDTGVFDYHHTAGDTLLVALDGVVWKLAPEPHPATPAGAVRLLLAEHMTADMGFTPVALAGKLELLSMPLRDRIARYFARLHPQDEPPPISGDPFTDSQEHPDRFTFGGVDAGPDRASVRVVFSDGSRTRPLDFLLVPHGARWLLDDIRYEDGTTFGELLRL